MSAADTLAAIIRREGAVTFDVFMDVALYDVDEGFFGRGHGAGRRGRDFVTAPEIGPLFGACVARALDRLVAGARRARSVPRRRSRCRLGPVGARDPARRAGLPAGPALRARRTVAGVARRSSARSSRSSRPTRRSGRSSTATSTRSSSPYAARVPCSRRSPTSRSCRPAASCSPTSCSTTSASGSPTGTARGGRKCASRRTVPSSARCSFPPPMPMRCAATRRRRARGADRCPPPDTARGRGLGRRMRRRIAERDRRGARLHRRRRRGAATRYRMVADLPGTRSRPGRVARARQPGHHGRRGSRATRTRGPCVRLPNRPRHDASGVAAPASASTSWWPRVDARGTQARRAATSRRSRDAVGRTRPPRSPTPAVSARIASSRWRSRPVRAARKAGSLGVDRGGIRREGGCGMADALEALLQEGRTFPPPERRAQGRVDHRRVGVRRRREGLAGSLGHAGARARLDRRVAHHRRVGASVREVVRRRSPQRRVQLRRPSRRSRSR